MALWVIPTCPMTHTSAQNNHARLACSGRHRNASRLIAATPVWASRLALGCVCVCLRVRKSLFEVRCALRPALMLWSCSMTALGPLTAGGGERCMLVICIQLFLLSSPPPSLPQHHPPPVLSARTSPSALLQLQRHLPTKKRVIIVVLISTQKHANMTSLWSLAALCPACIAWRDMRVWGWVG